MTIELLVTSVDRSGEAVNTFTRNIQIELAKTDGLKADLIRHPTAEDTKGLAAVVGGIALEVFKASAFAEIIKVLGAYLARDRKMTIKVKASNGTEIEITGTNINSVGIQETLNAIVTSQTGT